MRTWMLMHLQKYKVLASGYGQAALWKGSISQCSPKAAKQKHDHQEPMRRCLAWSDKLKQSALTGLPLTFQALGSFNPALRGPAASQPHPSGPNPPSASDGPSSGQEQPYVTHCPEWKGHQAYLILCWHFLGNKPSSPSSSERRWWF